MKSKIKYVPFVITGCCVALAWAIALGGHVLTDDPATRGMLSVVRKAAGWLGTACFFGGIILVAFLSAREADEETRRAEREKWQPVDPGKDDRLMGLDYKKTARIEGEQSLRERKQATHTIRVNMEENISEVKNGMPFTLVYALVAMLVLLSGIASRVSGGVGNVWVSLAWIVFGALFSFHYVRKFIRQIRYVRKLSATKSYPLLIKEVPIPRFDPEDPPVIRVLDNGTSCLVFGVFPPDEGLMPEGDARDFARILSDHLGVAVRQDDRELFIIESDHEDVITKVLDLFQQRY